MLAFLRGLHRSFPVQLFLLHLRSNFLLLLVWLLLAAMTSGLLGRRLGLQYLFLDPEYLGQGGYWPFVLLGITFGFLVMSWNLSTYLLVGPRFNFLASLSRPFFKFCINNALLPLAVLALHVVLIVQFYAPNADHTGAGAQVQSILGLLVGLAVSLFLYAIYFNATNRDIDYYRSKDRREEAPNRGPGRSLVRSQRLFRDNPLRVRTYLNERLGSRLVRSVAHYDSAVLSGVFRQNHVNALLLQFATIILLALLGLLSDRPFFQIPAGASFLILLSLLVSTVGAISYWFDQWRLPLLLLLLFVVNVITGTAYFERGNRAYGLNYDERVGYNERVLETLYGSEQLRTDSLAMVGILDNWRDRQAREKPPFVIVCASGGGLTAGVWATHVTQSIEECSGGDLLNATALMTGASGGMLGLAYLRSAYLHDDPFVAESAERLRRVSSDMLNGLAFSIVSNDVFLPFRTFDYAGETYYRDRAYAFEEEFDEVTDGLLDRPLADFAAPERSARIPLMLLTPSIVEDGRRLIISPQGVSNLTAPPAATRGRLPLKPDMVDFRWLFRDRGADSLRFLTALRASASYPYVLPQVELPTSPDIHLMDAGYRDNYGLATAARFVDVYQDWIRRNTSGVVVVQISAFREQEIEPGGRYRGVISSLVSPVGVAGTFLSLQILDQENLLGQMSDIVGEDRFHLYRFNYQPGEDDPLRTSVSLHMTEREKLLVLRALDEEQVQRDIDRLITLLHR